MFLHETKEENVEMLLMDSLANDMQEKANVTVPDKICFGRKRRGGLY